MWFGAKQPLVNEFPEALANRSAAYSEARGQLDLVQLLAWLVGALNNKLSELVRDHGGKRDLLERVYPVMVAHATSLLARQLLQRGRPPAAGSPRRLRLIP